MSRLKLDQYGKPGSTGQPFRPILSDSSAVRIHDPTSQDSNSGPIVLAREYLTTKPLNFKVFHGNPVPSNALEQSKLGKVRSPTRNAPTW
ncbi:unnamed protein product [Schistosoma margrebowiei]|uniref:Uncharacterized protein n=1 Tax=Schistosoma margrebowiei TaxID=48269 RepID=A0A183LB82_9TREM|nr:unnamed protein product [Schistosoma margrebowiei]